MKPLNLREFAEGLALTDAREHALEILENLDFIDTCQFEEIQNQLLHYSKDSGTIDNLKKLEWIGDRSHLLGEIQDELQKHKFEGDTDDVVRDLAETHRTIEGLLRDKGLLADDGDILESVLQLLERVPQYDL